MKKTILLAHRGFSGKYPENTRRAFMEALAVKGCDGFESDVHLSKDGEPVVIHDPVLDRTTNGTGFVRDFTFEELRKLDCGSWMGEEFKGEQIMHLDELLDLITEHDVFLNLEVKNYEVLYEGIEQIVIDRIRAKKAEKRVLLSSFNHISMEICKDIDPEIETGFLYNTPLISAEKYAASYRPNALHPKYTCFFIEPDLVQRAHEAGYQVNTWTANTIEDIKMCLKLGVDSIISNYPDLLAQVAAAEEVTQNE